MKKILYKKVLRRMSGSMARSSSRSGLNRVYVSMSGYKNDFICWRWSISANDECCSRSGKSNKFSSNVGFIYLVDIGN